MYILKIYARVLENEVYGLGTGKANREHMQDKKMKHGEHDWETFQFSATKWIGNK